LKAPYLSIYPSSKEKQGCEFKSLVFSAVFKLKINLRQYKATKRFQKKERKEKNTTIIKWNFKKIKILHL
jgi:hypothetical protein